MTPRSLLLKRHDFADSSTAAFQIYYQFLYRHYVCFPHRGNLQLSSYLDALILPAVPGGIQTFFAREGDWPMATAVNF